MSTSSVRILFLGDSASAVRSVNTLERSFGGLGRTAKLVTGVITVGFIGSLAAAAKQAIQFDKSMRNVNSIAKLSEKQFQSLSKSVLALSKTTGKGPKDLADGLYDIVSSGFKANDAVTILTQTAKAATAGLTDTATATKAVVAVLNAYHLSAGKARSVSNTLFQEVNLGVNTFEELAQNIGDTAPQAAALKIPFEQVAAALATITLHGTSMAEASTQVSRVLTAMVKPTKDLSGEFKDMGFASGQAAVAALGFSGVIQRLSRDAGGNQQTLAAWLGDIRGIRGVLNLTGANLESFTGNVRKMGAAQQGVGATQKAFAEQAKSISFQWQLAKASLAAAAVPIGQLLFPALIKGAQGVARLATAVTEHMPEIRRVVHQVSTAVKTVLDTVLIPAFRRAREIAVSVVDTIRANWPQIRPTVMAVKEAVVAALTAIKVVVQALVPVIVALQPVFKLAFGAMLLIVRGFAIVFKAQMQLVIATVHAVEGAIHGLVSAFEALKRAGSFVGGIAGKVGGAVGKAIPGRAMGGFVPGSAPGSPTLILAHAGEVILNRSQQQALGGAGAIARMFGFTGQEGPAFAGGGFVGKPAGQRNTSVPNRRGKPSQLSAVTAAGKAAFAAVGAVQQRESDLQSAYDLLSRDLSIEQTYHPVVTTDAQGNQSLDQAELSKQLAEIDGLIASRQHMIQLVDTEKRRLQEAVAALKLAIARLLDAIASAREAAAAETRQIGSLEQEVAQISKDETAEQHRYSVQTTTKMSTAQAKAARQTHADTMFGLRKHRAAAEQKIKGLRGQRTAHQNQASKWSGELGGLRTDLASAQQTLGHDIAFRRGGYALDVTDLRGARGQLASTTVQAAGGGLVDFGGGGSTGGGADLGSAIAGGDQGALQAALTAALEQIGRLSLALGVQNVQIPVIASFQKGTLHVPQTGLYELHAGEQVTSAGRGRTTVAGGDVAVHLHVANGMEWLRDYVRVEVVRGTDAISTVQGRSAERLRREGRF